MDSNQVNPPTPQPAPNTPSPVVMQAEAPKGNKMMLVIIMVVVVLILLIGGSYFYFNSQKQTTPKSQQAAGQGEFNKLDTEAKSVNIEEVDNDFAPVDQDLQSL